MKDVLRDQANQWPLFSVYENVAILGTHVASALPAGARKQKHAPKENN